LSAKIGSTPVTVPHLLPNPNYCDLIVLCNLFIMLHMTEYACVCTQAVGLKV